MPASHPTERPSGASLPLPAVVVGFAALVLVLRGSTFFHSVENWDESLYLLMARSVLEGHPLYTEIWDHKPPGIFYLFALAQLVFGRSVVSIRILAWLAVTLSTLLLFLLGRRLRSETTGLVAGVLYAAFSLNDGGLASNVELFFTPLLLLALYLALSPAPAELLDQPSRPLVLGLVSGLALQMKYIVVFDLAAFFLFLLVSFRRQNRGESSGRLLRFIGLAGLGALVPLAVVATYFAASGHFAEYFDANFAANVRYVSEVGFDYRKLLWMLERRIRESFLLWLGLGVAPAYLVFWRDLDRDTRRGLAASLLWVVFAFFGICATRRLFAHYFLALTPPLCLIAALVISAAVEGNRSRMRTFLLLTLVLAGPLLRTVERPLLQTARAVRHHWFLQDPLWDDEPAQIAEYLRPRVAAGDYLYVADYHPILYYLLPVRLPTRFPLPPHLVEEQWKELTGFDTEAEVRNIFAKRPVYVIKAEEKHTPFYRILREELDRGYRLERNVGSVELYRRID